MMVIRKLAFCASLLYVLGAMITETAARSTGSVVQPVQIPQDALESTEYEMLITPDEEERIVQLLGPEYLEVGLVATKVTGAPRRCPVCGKETEFVDWVFTALARGIHSPSFIVESLKLGNSPKKLAHDVYCSGCGHLTHFRDPSGAEGGAPYIALASPYDRASRTFAPGVFAKREVEEIVPESAVNDEAAPAPPPRWEPYWTRKRDSEGLEGGVDAVAPLPPRWQPYWTRKRGDDHIEDVPETEAASPLPPRWQPYWTRKRSEEHSEAGAVVEAESAASPLPPAWKPYWTRKRDDEHVDEIADLEDSAPLPPRWQPYWTRKREEDASSPFPPKWQPYWTRKRGNEDTDVLEDVGSPLPPRWKPYWTRKQGDNAVIAETDATSPLPPRWQPYWTRKQGDEHIEESHVAEAESPLPPAWKPYWTRKRGDAIARGTESASPLPPAWKPYWTRKREDDHEDARPPSWSAHQWQVKVSEGAAHNLTLGARCIERKDDDEVALN
ncbi:hypothetical protein C8Q77DRAFT_1160238 [Trametes polyzona]|nr:hypothetical protein C8Q77DRAFT_1160238 [Trametes polyzona]